MAVKIFEILPTSTTSPRRMRAVAHIWDQDGSANHPSPPRRHGVRQLEARPAGLQRPHVDCASPAASSYISLEHPRPTSRAGHHIRRAHTNAGTTRLAVCRRPLEARRGARVRAQPRRCASLSRGGGAARAGVPRVAAGSRSTWVRCIRTREKKATVPKAVGRGCEVAAPIVTSWDAETHRRTTVKPFGLTFGQKILAKLSLAPETCIGCDPRCWVVAHGLPRRTVA